MSDLNKNYFEKITYRDALRLAMHDAMIEDKKISLYVAQTKNGRAKLLVNKALNSAYGTPMYWLSDSRGLIIKTTIDRRGPAPTDNTTPSGPILQENLGIVSPARTYQDLLSRLFLLI